MMCLLLFLLFLFLSDWILKLFELMLYPAKILNNQFVRIILIEVDYYEKIYYVFIVVIVLSMLIFLVQGVWWKIFQKSNLIIIFTILCYNILFFCFYLKVNGEK